MNKSRGLGKGLGALIPELAEENQNTEAQLEVSITDIQTNPYQPRKEFTDEKINELAESIRVHGIIQPLLVRANGNQYQLIAGERRLRAAKLIGLTNVPVVVREMTDQAMMEVALVENLQREDLNSIEEAEAYQRLMNEFQLTQDEIAKKVGKSRSAIANTLRLLNLPSEIQKDLGQGTLTMGHARALLSLKTIDEQKRIWSQIQLQELSVRETEEMIRQLTASPTVSRETKETKKEVSKSSLPLNKDPNMMEVEDELQQALGTKVIIKQVGSGGKIEIDYYSSEDFERICDKLIH